MDFAEVQHMVSTHPGRPVGLTKLLCAAYA